MDPIELLSEIRELMLLDSDFPRFGSMHDVDKNELHMTFVESGKSFLITLKEA